MHGCLVFATVIGLSLVYQVANAGELNPEENPW
jgi:hypothetical protein